MTAAPYPADTRAKGWRFELDLERVRQSDTWALAAPEVRPWLLMLWCTAWEQTPCGSLPAEDELIAARIGMAPKLFAKHRAVLLRGWWKADDGRMYHPTITALVLGMVTRKDAEKARKAAYRARVSRGTDSGQDAGRSRDSAGRDDTGTGTGTSKGDTENSHDAGGGAEVITAGFQPTAAGAVCRQLRQAGIADVNPGHPRLLALLQAGAQPAEFTGFVPAALAKSQRAPFAYLLGMVEGERTRAASMAGQLHRGALPNRQEAIEQRNAAVGDAWATGTA